MNWSRGPRGKFFAPRQAFDALFPKCRLDSPRLDLALPKTTIRVFLVSPSPLSSPCCSVMGRTRYREAMPKIYKSDPLRTHSPRLNEKSKRPPSLSPPRSNPSTSSVHVTPPTRVKDNSRLSAYLHSDFVTRLTQVFLPIKACLTRVHV